MKFLRLLLGAVLPVSCVSAFGESEGDHLPLAEVIVAVASRAPEPLSKVGSSVTVLNQATIEDSQATVIADLLAQTPGLGMVRSGGYGTQTSVFIRGAESGQTLVLIDGVRISDESAPDGGFDFADLLTGDLSRVEILRGSHSTVYGSQAIGGVIDIQTTPPAGALSGTLSVEGGSRSTGMFSGSAGGKEGDFAWHVAGQHFQTGGIPDFDRRLGGTTPDDHHNNSFSGRATYGIADGWNLDLHSYYTHSRTRFDGYDTPTGTFGDDREYGTSVQSIQYLAVNGTQLGGRLHQRFDGQLTETARYNYDPALTGDTQTFYGIGRNRRLEYQGTLELTPTQRAIFGLQAEHASMSTDTPAYDQGPGLVRAHARTNSAYAEWTATVVPALTLSAGARVDDHDAFGRHATSQASAAWSVHPGTIVRASFGEGFKSPALYQLYSQYGNPALRPEQSDSWDAGIEQHLFADRATVTATYFHRDSHALIGFVDCSTPAPLCATEPFGFYANVTRARAQGVELAGSARLGSAWIASANYTFLSDLDRSPGSATYGRELWRRPRDSGNLALSYCPSWPLTLSSTARYAGRSFDDPANQIRLGGYVVLDLRASYALSERYELYGRVENLTDRQYEVAYQYGTLGRGFFAGLRARL